MNSSSRTRLLLRMKLSGDVEVNMNPSNHAGGFLLSKAPATLIQDVRELQSVSVLGVYSARDRQDRTEVASFPYMPGGYPPPLEGAWFSEASLKRVARVAIFNNKITGFCMGILLHYHDGGQRSLGQCRIVVDPFEECVAPVRICLSPTVNYAPVITKNGSWVHVGFDTGRRMPRGADVEITGGSLAQICIIVHNFTSIHVRMASLLRRLPWPGRTWKPLTFPNPNFKRIALDEKIEEELFPDYVASRYYPVRIGEVLRDRYQIVGKLGFGASSTVWLARDLDGRRHVALKLFMHSKSMGEQLEHELAMYKRISASSTTHSGRDAVRDLLESFDVTGPDGSHRCLVHPPLWGSALAFLRLNPVERLPVPVLAFILRRLFLALDFLHTECQIIHTDIKADNIMFGVEDDTVFSAFEEQEQVEPSPRKQMDGRDVYLSRELQLPKNWGAPVLGDFGSAVTGDIEHTEDVQPDIYRAPEVILEAPWSYQVDIWNTGCMIWDLFERQHLFTGHDPESQTYRSRAHLAEIIALLGPPPQTLLESGKSSHKFFTDTGDFCKDISIPESITLEEIEIGLEGESQQKFLAMMRRMLQWDPSKRSSAKELADDEWIMENI
ncbi:hypothetical protein FSARC_4974 [Fusarium sarcochroum]|uniref:non-specific serine/threonine protein kinase n=1 Tax=Fusarium sarcochroum TaxID=1208366 RepID=A0A8H4U0V1_9HYPO|nr:hypothetical protein FSARC_4974 [Fusarium sarcochroum]